VADFDFILDRTSSSWKIAWKNLKSYIFCYFIDMFIQIFKGQFAQSANYFRIDELNFITQNFLQLSPAFAGGFFPLFVGHLTISVRK